MIAIIPAGICGPAAFAQSQVLSAGGKPAILSSTRDLYTKVETFIPMRDGVRLYTVIFTPKDISKNYPILLTRTPYGVPYGPDNFPDRLGPSPLFTHSGYIVACQDVRGTHLSEGSFVNMRPLLSEKRGPKDSDESTDAYDTIDWLVHSAPHNNGRVGMWGISYPGFYADAGALCGHSALKAVSPQAPIADWFLGDDEHHNGALFLMDDFEWEFGFGFDYPRAAPTKGNPQPHHEFPSNDAYQFYLDMGPLKNADETYLKHTIPYWNELMSHDIYDSYGQARSLLPHFGEVKPALLTVGGWFDAEDFFGTLATFKYVGRRSPSTASYLAIGPWPHGGWSRGNGDRFGGLSFGSATGTYFREKIEFPFFEYYLKDVGAPPTAKAQVFDTGANRWLSLDSWPPRDAAERVVYLGADHALSNTPPESPAKTADTYVSDPANPVPYSSRAHSQIQRYTPYMDEDQRFVDARPDVLTYRSAPLSADETVVGPVGADLYVSLSGTDADFVVKLIDIYPDARAAGDATGSDDANLAGEEILVRADVLRGKFRDSFERPQPFTPGTVTKIRFDLPDICHTFRKGHRIAVQIQSSWFPLVDRNPQTFVNINTASASDFKKEEVSIFRSAEHPSRIILFAR